MEQSLNQLWTLCIWYFGISATITVGIFGWIVKLNGKVSMKQTIHEDLNTITKDLREIKTALIGDYDKKGLLTKHHELEDRVKTIESKG